MTLFRNTATVLVGSVVPILVSLVTVPLYIHAIGLERYGILLLVWTMLGDFGFASLGMGSAVQQGIAALRRGSDIERGQVFWAGTFGTAAAAALGAGLLLLVSGIYFARVDASPGLMTELEAAVPYIAFFLPMVLLANLSEGAIMGRERFLNATVVTSFGSIMQATFPLLAAVMISPELPTLLAAALVGRGLQAIAQFAQCFWIVPAGRPHLPTRALFARLFGFGGWMTLRSILGSVLKNAERYFIGAAMGAGAVSIYGIPANLVSRIQILPDAFARVLFPRFAAQGEADQAALEDRSIRAISAVMTPAVLFGAMALGPFMTLWLGPEVAQRSVPIGAALMAGWWANSFARVSASRLTGGGRPHLVTKVLMIEAPIYAAIVYAVVGFDSLTLIACLWSLRALIDSAWLLALTGMLRPVFRHLLLPTLLVCCSTAIVCVSPAISAPAIAAQAILLAVGSVLSWRMAPDQLRAMVRRSPL